MYLKGIIQNQKNKNNMNENENEKVEVIEVTEVSMDVTDNNKVINTGLSTDKHTAAIVSAESWEAKLAIADSMIDGGLVPKSFANDPGAVISAVEMGLELGLGAWTSLNNIVVIQGKATLTLNAMLSLARNKGVLINVVKDYELVPLERKTKDGIKKMHERATVVMVTRGEDIYSPSGKLLDSRISEYTYTKYWQDAVKAELTDKDNWKRMPRQMLRARAITEALRLYAADILLGMYETVEIAENSNTIIDVN